MDLTDKNGYTALAKAAEKGDIGLVKLFTDHQVPTLYIKLF